MQIMDILSEMGGIQSIARDLKISESEATAGVAALVPAILGGFKKQAQAPSGLEGLGGLLGQLGGGGLLESVLSPQVTDVSQGNDVLGQIFGSKDVSRTVAQDASRRSGLDTTLLKKMLPIVAMLITGYMARHGEQQSASPGGGLGGLLGGLLGRAGTSAAPAQGTGGLASMLDLNGDGNPLDDILQMAGKMMR